MIYKTFEEWKAGQWLEDCEPRTEAYTEDELLLVEMGWKYGFDAGKQQTKPTITKLDGKVVAVTMTDDEHRITEVLWEAQKPLSDDEIDKLADEYLSDYFNMQETINFARAIEERHGIK